MKTTPIKLAYTTFDDLLKAHEVSTPEEYFNLVVRHYHLDYHGYALMLFKQLRYIEQLQAKQYAESTLGAYNCANWMRDNIVHPAAQKKQN